MSDRIAVFSDGPHRAGRHAGRDLRAPGERVRRGLRRHVERPRARRRAASPCARRRSACSTTASRAAGGMQSAAGAVREVVYLGSVDALRRRAGRGRDAGRAAPEPRRRRRGEALGGARPARAAGVARRSTPTRSGEAEHEEEENAMTNRTATRSALALAATMAVVACGGESPSESSSRAAEAAARGERRRRRPRHEAADVDRPGRGQAQR